MQRSSIRSGRISFVVLAGLVSVAMVCVLFLFNGQSPHTAASEFMSALAKGDVNELTKLSYVEGKSSDQVRKEWEEATKYGGSYLFGWTITNVTQNSDTTAAARVEITNNPLSPQAYPESRPLTLIKENGTWKVDVTQLTREAYPYLPK